MVHCTHALKTKEKKKMKTPVKGITFDLDDTLWCGRQVLSKANESFHLFISDRIPELNEMFPQQVFNKLLMQFQQDMPEKAHDYTFLRKHTLRHCIKQIDHSLVDMELEVFIQQAFDAFLIPRSQPEFFEGVEELFHDLYQELLLINQTDQPNTIMMGAITNGNCLIEYLPLFFKKYIDFFVSAEQVGQAKPHRQVFDAALEYFEKNNIERKYIVHVGDHYECDIIGAKKAGLRTIWINPKWTKPSTLTRQELSVEDRNKYPDADAIIQQVTDVSKVIRLWNQQAVLEHTNDIVVK
jgi:HAD superfamily hydrolase (TIGR01549 family)